MGVPMPRVRLAVGFKKNKKAETDAAREVGSWIENGWPFGLWLAAGLVLLLEEYIHT